MIVFVYFKCMFEHFLCVAWETNESKRYHRISEDHFHLIEDTFLLQLMKFKIWPDFTWLGVTRHKRHKYVQFYDKNLPENLRGILNTYLQTFRYVLCPSFDLMCFLVQGRYCIGIFIIHLRKVWAKLRPSSGHQPPECKYFLSVDIFNYDMTLQIPINKIRFRSINLSVLWNVVWILKIGLVVSDMRGGSKLSPLVSRVMGYAPVRCGLSGRVT